MKIKRIQAIDMPTALEKVRGRHGPDAVIISTRDLSATEDGARFGYRGIELMVGVEEKPAAGRAKPAARSTAAVGAGAAYAGTLAAPGALEQVENRGGRPAQVAAMDIARLPRVGRDDQSAIEREPGREPFAALLNRVSGLVETPAPEPRRTVGAGTRLAATARSAFAAEKPAAPLPRNAPEAAAQQAYALLCGVGLADGLVEQALAETIRLMPHRALGDTARLLEVALSRLIATLPQGPALTPRALAGQALIFVGAAGVGKTTALLKAALHLRDAGGDVGIVGADVSHLGALEQLLRYGQLLQLPVAVAYGPDDLRDLLAAAPPGRITLVDTPACRPGARPGAIVRPASAGSPAITRGPAIHRGAQNGIGGEGEGAGDELLDLLAAAPRRLVALTVAASSGEGDLKRLGVTARAVGAEVVAVTKLDDARSEAAVGDGAGAALNVLAHLRLSPLLCSTGRDVLADLRLPTTAELAVSVLEEAAGGR